MTNSPVTKVQTRYGVLEVIPSDLIVSESFRLYGEWAQLELEMHLAFIGSGMTVIDIGAFIGGHSLAYAAGVGPAGKVISFEPRKAVYDLLKSNLEGNRLDASSVYCLGLDETQAWYKNIADKSSELNPGGFSLSRLDAVPSDATDTLECRTLDSFDLSSCHFIKLDVEGMEVSVLRGASATLARFRPVVSAEVNSLEAGAPLLSFCREHHYEAYAHLAPAYNPANFLAQAHNIFANAAELSLVLIPSEARERYQDQIARFRLARCEELEDLVLALLHKPQYYPEYLFKTHTCGVLGGAIRHPGFVGLELAKNDLQSQLEQQNALLSSQGNQLADALQEVGELKGQLASALQRAEQLNSTLENTRAASDSIARELAEIRKVVAAQNVQIADQRVSSDLLYKQIVHLEQQHAALLASSSWKLTAPVRWLVTSLKRMFRP